VSTGDPVACVGAQRERIRLNLQLFADMRTEPATPRRRQEARRKGQVARTGELSSALVLLAGFGALYLWLPHVSGELITFTRRLYEGALLRFASVEASEIPTMFLDWSWLAVRLAGPIALVTMVVGFASQLVQVGFLTSSEPLKPQLKRIDPISGFQRIFSKRALVELLKATLKVTLVGALAYGAVRSSLGEYTEYMKLGPAQAAIQTGRAVFRLAFWIGLCLLVLALFDYLYQRWEHEQSLRMSRRELKEELRQTEGDPQIRARIRQRQRQLASSRMMAKVPTADVVITNPVHLAVALKYDPVEMDAPTVVAKGAGPLARRIKEVAREHGVTIVENVWLARALYESVPVDGRIPEELYKAVAEVLAFVYRLRGKNVERTRA
jgi:flagellar biosynthetic protein FlhB